MEETAIKQTTCDECDGTGNAKYPVEYNGEMITKCPWCEGTGKVDESYLVRCHGHNGDFPFSEIWDIVFSLDDAKALCERVMKTDRFQNVLDNGKPTITWMEIQGPHEVIGLDETGWQEQ